MLGNLWRREARAVLRDTLRHAALVLFGHGEPWRDGPAAAARAAAAAAQSPAQPRS